MNTPSVSTLACRISAGDVLAIPLRDTTASCISAGTSPLSQVSKSALDRMQTHVGSRCNRRRCDLRLSNIFLEPFNTSDVVKHVFSV